jgi:ribosomal protein S12 methylthiotransferase accessory factor
VARHYVAARPQCPVCGRQELRDPLRDAQRTPVPPRLRAGGKLVMTGRGGYRAVAPAVTVARFRRHVSPLTGVASQLERIATICRQAAMSPGTTRRVRKPWAPSGPH